VTSVKISSYFTIHVIKMRSYRRIHIDNDLASASKYIRGTTLNIGGGRKLGRFRAPESESIIHTVLDIDPSLNPDVTCDAHNLPIQTGTVDTVIASELLEHCANPNKVICEISRVLKSGGTLILTVPFMVRLHRDPDDFYRFSDTKLKDMLNPTFEIEHFKKQGLFFTVIANSIRDPIINSKSQLRFLAYPMLPLLDAVRHLDSFDFVKSSRLLSAYTTGFFLVAKRRADSVQAGTTDESVNGGTCHA